jgi:hypothetical protein
MYSRINAVMPRNSENLINTSTTHYDFEHPTKPINTYTQATYEDSNPSNILVRRWSITVLLMSVHMIIYKLIIYLKYSSNLSQLYMHEAHRDEFPNNVGVHAVYTHDAMHWMSVFVKSMPMHGVHVRMCMHTNMLREIYPASALYIHIHGW